LRVRLSVTSLHIARPVLCRKRRRRITVDHMAGLPRIVFASKLAAATATSQRIGVSQIT